MLRMLFAGIGGVFFFGGVLVFLTPIPLGMLMMLVGLPLILRNSPRMSGWIKHRSRGFPRIAALVARVEARQNDASRG